MSNDPNRRPIDGGLQAIAGMIRKLTYREMQEFAKAMHEEMQADVPVGEFADSLLGVADKFAAPSNPNGLVPR